MAFIQTLMNQFEPASAEAPVVAPPNASGIVPPPPPTGVYDSAKVNDKMIKLLLSLKQLADNDIIHQSMSDYLTRIESLFVDTPHNILNDKYQSILMSVVASKDSFMKISANIDDMVTYLNNSS